MARRRPEGFWARGDLWYQGSQVPASRLLAEGALALKLQGLRASEILFWWAAPALAQGFEGFGREYAAEGCRRQTASCAGLRPKKLRTPKFLDTTLQRETFRQLQAASSVFPTAAVEFTSDDALNAQNIFLKKTAGCVSNPQTVGREFAMFAKV